MSLPLESFSAMPTFFQIFTALAPSAASAASCAFTFASQAVFSKPFTANVVAQCTRAGSVFNCTSAAAR